MSKHSAVLIVGLFLIGLFFGWSYSLQKKAEDVEKLRQCVEQKCIVEFAAHDIPRNTVIKAEDLVVREAAVEFQASPFKLPTCVGMKFGNDIRAGEVITTYWKYPAVGCSKNFNIADMHPDYRNLFLTGSSGIYGEKRQ